MTDCPSIRDLLERRQEDEVAAHVDGCVACQAVVTMIADNVAPQSEEPGCAVAELQIAAREAGLLSGMEAQELAAHLERCASCRSADDAI